jgi:hypothetical protein
LTISRCTKIVYFSFLSIEYVYQHIPNRVIHIAITTGGRKRKKIGIDNRFLALCCICLENAYREYVSRYTEQYVCIDGSSFWEKVLLRFDTMIAIRNAKRRKKKNRVVEPSSNR